MRKWFLGLMGLVAVMLYGGIFEGSVNHIERQLQHPYDAAEAIGCMSSHTYTTDLCGTIFTVPGIVTRHGDVARLGGETVTKFDLLRVYNSVRRDDPQKLGNLRSFDEWWAQL